MSEVEWNLREELAKVIRQRREWRGLEQKEVARLAGLSPMAACRVEHFDERTSMNINHLERVAHVLDTTIPILFIEALRMRPRTWKPEPFEKKKYPRCPNYHLRDKQ